MEKTIISDDRETTWYLIKEWETKSGLTARVQQCVWKVTVLLKPHYTGYVQVPDNIKLHDTENTLDVHGGVTFGYPEPRELKGADGLWVGFDMAHYGDEDRQDLNYAISECERLAEQIVAPTK